jgi:hypothetical protein
MTTRHRKSSTDHAHYHPVPQSPLAPNTTGSLVLGPEDDEEAVDEVLLVPEEVSTAIRLVHFVFGCAMLLPWNGVSPQNRRFMTIMAYYFFDSDDYRNALFPRPTRRIIAATRFPFLPIPHILDVKFRVLVLHNSDSETGTA